jgi:hypothetical protein
MADLGRKGGQKTSPAKQPACRLNAAKARAAAAAKRANGLPNFNEGAPRPAAYDLPPFKSETVSDLSAPPPEPTPPPSQPDLSNPKNLRTAVITKPAESGKLLDLKPAPKHAPAVERPRPPRPNPPVLRTPFDHAVRMAHKTFNPRCVCSFCVP